LKHQLINLIHSAVASLGEQGVLPQVPDQIKLDHTRDKAHGDFATNIAMVLAKQAGMPPRQLAQKIIDAIPANEAITRVEIAGPGFINFFLKSGAANALISDVLDKGRQYGLNQSGEGVRVQIEFVSANPTGPLHVGHGRGAAYGASLANLLMANGYELHREYYVNDAGRQMDILAVSVWMRYLELAGETMPFPANGYQGDYIWDIGATLHREDGDRYRHSASAILQGLPADAPEGDKELYIDALIERCKTLLGATDYARVHQQGHREITENIRRDLAEFGVEYDEWFSEASLMNAGAVSEGIQRLQDAGHIYEKNGALWFRSTAFGDEKDRVVQRDNGLYTYFASDIAYHMNKLDRGFDRLINIWGADHHGYVPRVRAAIQALGGKPEQLEVMLVQFAVLYRGGEQVKMSTRSGDFVTLRELRQEVGNDAARFFYVMRKPEQHLDFDLDLAKSQSNDNPVYYIQYAHARVSSVFRQLQERGMSWDRESGLDELDLLTEMHEQELIKQISKYPEIIHKAGAQHEPHQITYYLRDLAQAFHTYYNAHTFLTDDELLRNARLCLVVATQQVIRNGLGIIGVSAPEEMHREDEEELQQ
jgi:arginyl-tRNA synthetase